MGKSIFAIGAFLTASLYNFAAYKKETPSDVRVHLAVQERTASAEDDRITMLPGLDYDPGFEQFSGYLDVSATRHIFYWYMESQSDPTNDPVVLWTNGGPGCSGLLGMGAEHGPFYISKSGRLHDNPYSWNKVANMIYFEQPAGVGFSYCDAAEDYITGDEQAAADNYNFIVEFLQRYPERQTNDFYVSSESYGGHYIPQMTLEILRRDIDHFVNFKGFLLGNPYVDPLSNMVTQFEAYYSHGLIAKPLFDDWSKKCKDSNYWMSRECDQITTNMFKQFGHGINPYALDYPVCKKDAAEYSHLERPVSNRNHRVLKTTKDGHDPMATATLDISNPSTSSIEVDTLLNRTNGQNTQSDPQAAFKPCSQEFLENYLDREEVRDALHVAPSAKPWDVCGGVRYSKSDVDIPTIGLYQELIDQAKAGKHDLNMLIYSGDDDSICSTAGTQYWLWDLAEASSIWKAWQAQEQTSGFVTTFDLGDKTNATFTFVTVHGAGHEVPSYRPVEALEMFRRFLAHGF